jgi:sec-independent protein translocase protein TatB
VFNIGPFELLVLIAVALLVFGPDKLPQLTKDATRMLRTLRDMAQGARSQLSDELGPEFANFDLNSLNPKAAIRNALLGDTDLSDLNPADFLQKALRGDSDTSSSNGASANGSANGASSALMNGSANGASSAGSTPAAPSETGGATGGAAPLNPGESAPYDSDAT